MCEARGYVEGQSDVFMNWVFWGEGEKVGLHKGEKTLKTSDLSEKEQYKYLYTIGLLISAELTLIDEILTEIEEEHISRVLNIPTDPRVN